MQRRAMLHETANSPYAPEQLCRSREAQMHRDAPSQPIHSPQLHIPPDLRKTDDGIKHKRVCAWISGPDRRARDIPKLSLRPAAKIDITHVAPSLHTNASDPLPWKCRSLPNCQNSNAAATKRKSKQRSDSTALAPESLSRCPDPFVSPLLGELVPQPSSHCAMLFCGNCSGGFGYACPGTKRLSPTGEHPPRRGKRSTAIETGGIREAAGMVLQPQPRQADGLLIGN